MATKKSNKSLWVMLALIAAIIAVILLLPSCGNRNAKKGAETDAESTTLVKAGDTAPDFTVEMVDGSSVTLGDLKGKVVLLNFWATWCTPCMNEVPHLKKAYETFHAKGFEIYGVSLDTDLTRWENTIGEEDVNWINVAQKKGGGFDPTALYAVSSISANFLISPEGKIVAKNLRGEHLEAKLAEVLK